MESIWAHLPHIDASQTKYHALYSPKRTKQRLIASPFALINTVLFLSYMLIFGYVIHHSSKIKSTRIYSPAQSTVSYETRRIDTSIHTPFRQEPGPEADAAWGQLLRYNNVVVSIEDLHKLNRSSVALRDGSGYLGTIDVFHELHCLNYIREYSFPEYYELETEKTKYEHIFHCIDHIRAILMCHADVSVHTFEWLSTAHYPVIKSRATHVCRKWEPIVEWAKEHYPSHDHGPILEHPKYGIIQPTMANDTDT